MTKDEIIDELTRLLIKQEMIDRKKGKKTYVKKTIIYEDLIKWFNEHLK